MGVFSEFPEHAPSRVNRTERRLSLAAILLSLVAVGLASKNVFQHPKDASLTAVPPAYHEMVGGNVQSEEIFSVLEQDKIRLLNITEAGVQERFEKFEQERIAGEIADPLKPVVDINRPYLGHVDAPNTIVFYSAPSCPHCRTMLGRLEELLTKRGEANLRVFFKHMPRTSADFQFAIVEEALGMESIEEAKTLREWAYADSGPLQTDSDAALKQYLDGRGLDSPRIMALAMTDEISKIVTGDNLEGVGFGFNGVPNIIVNGVALKGEVPLDAIEDILAKTQGRPTISRGPTDKEIAQGFMQGQGGLDSCGDAASDCGDNSEAQPR